VSEEKRLAVQGPQGPQGKRGEKGASGLSGTIARSLVILFAIAALLGGGGLFWAARDQDANAASQRREQASQLAAQRHEEAEQQAEQRREQAEQQRASALLNARLCLTFQKLTALKPPAGNPAANPARAYLQAQHDTLAQLGTDLGCK
jgi:hypothetical protein